MLRHLMLAAAAVLSLGAATVGGADTAEAKPGWKHGGHHRGWGGGPPPWAPAHGWRRKHGWGGGYGYRRGYGGRGYGYGYGGGYGRGYW